MNDVTGRSQFARNVAITWIAHIFVLVGGFLLPRQISDSLGAEALGIWDLGWATVRYLSLTSMGFGSALTRYSAMYSAEGNYGFLNRAYTAVCIWQVAAALVISLISYAFCWSLPIWLEVSESSNISEAQIAIFLLGISLSFRQLAIPAGGLITGAHRWDLQNSLTAAQDFILIAMMILAMLLGKGLVALAVLAVATEFVFVFIRHTLAHKLVPNAKFLTSEWNTKTAMEMLRYGAKSQLNTLPNILIFQTLAILLSAYAGPAVLAILNRGVALVKQANIIIVKATMMANPITSSLIGLKHSDQARELLVTAGKYSFCIVLPICIGLFWFGDLVILIWMGPEYANRSMMSILAIGAVLPMGLSGTRSVLAGLNAHGKVAIYSILTTILALIISIPIAHHYGWTETSAAIIASFAWPIGLAVPQFYFLRKLFSISIATYTINAIAFPLICNIPLAISLGIGRHALLNEQWILMIASFSLGGLATASIYWKWILNEKSRELLVNKFFRN